MKDEIEKYAMYVGKEGHITVQGMSINVRCIDYKKSYGKERWLVEPISGSGSSWSEQCPIDRVTIKVD